MYQNILFDLDGTIINSAPGITRAAAYALKHYEIYIDDLKTLERFIGPPLVDSFKKMGVEKPLEAIDYFREYYTEKGIFECELYEGIDKLLKDLKASRKKVILATSKPEHFAKKILSSFHLEDCFDFIGGATMDERRTSKSDVIAYVLDANNINSENSIMIGDRHHDIDGANHFNMESIGVLYGFGNHDELTVAGANYIVNNVSELYKVLNL